MPSIGVEKLAELQKKPSHVRNICILAHVDHGKTTLADTLVASNGIISQRMAGKLRYLDSREDEQTRGITMKSSAISLHYHNNEEEYLVNLIDSPGHVDFSSEVSTAVRLCDGAIVIVDVVEGVCPQTHAVLRQAWQENIKPILVLNKIDRLITELKMEPAEAFTHLQQILEHVNVLTSELFTSDMMSLQKKDVSANGTESQTCDWTEDADEMEHKNIYFSPDQDNVVFACAYDGWGFTVGQFAKIYSKKLGMNEDGLRKCLWGDYYLNSKAKRVMKGAQGKGKKPLFVQFVLETIWSVYDCVMVKKDKEKIEKIVTTLNLRIAPRDARHADTRVHVQAIMSQWLPVSQAVLGVVVDKLPSPVEMLEDKVENLLCNLACGFDSLPPQTQQLKQAFLACDSAEKSPVIIYVSKMFPVDKSVLPKHKQRPLTKEELQDRYQAARLRHAAKMEDTQSQNTNGVIDGTQHEDKVTTKDAIEEGPDQVFIAFARVYSGTVRTGQKLYVLAPKHNPAEALLKLSEDGHLDSNVTLEEHHICEVTITDLYMFMGRELESLDSVPAGNILGIGGLEDLILKQGTLSSTVACPAFTDLYLHASPILRVAVEPTRAGDMQALMRGLKLLNQADPCVQVLVQETGEHVIITAGEVHLRRCLDDLTERYAKIEISASSPIVPFRETIVPPPTMDMVNESIQDQVTMARTDRSKEVQDDEEILEDGLVRIFTPSKHCMVQIRALPLPSEVTNYLEENQLLIKMLDQYVDSQSSDRYHKKDHITTTLKQSTKEALQVFKDKLQELFTEAGKVWTDFVDSIWAFGPKRIGPNLLINKVEGYSRSSIWDFIAQNKNENRTELRDYDYSVVSGFQLATLTGPLCEEPMRGVCFVVEKWEIGIDLKQPKHIQDSVDNIEETVKRLLIDDEQLIMPKLHKNVCKPPVEYLKTSNDSETVLTSNFEDKASCSVKPTEVSLDLDSPDIISDRVSSAKVFEVQGHVSGQLISIVREGCRKSFQTQPQRLMAAMYKCNIQATTEALGRLYGVIGKRHGRILGEDMKEGSQTFIIEAVIPVVESFGFADDMRKKTSGLASPQLVFHSWEVIDVDPFWVPTTEEEIMHYGEKADSENRARVYMNNVRERKGLKVDKKIVEHAEKQRTLTRNK